MHCVVIELKAVVTSDISLNLLTEYCVVITQSHKQNHERG